MPGIRAELRLPLVTLARTRRAWGGVLLLALLTIAQAAVLHGRAHGVDAALPFLGGVTVPLVAYAFAGAVLGGGRLATASAPLVGLGVPAPRVRFGLLLAAVLPAMLASALLAVVVVVSAHVPLDPPRALDAPVSTAMVLVGSAAYASLFVLGGTFDTRTPRGLGRAALLVLDVVLGQDTGPAAAITPRAHLRSLLGGPPVLSLPGRASLAILAAIAILSALLVVRPRPRRSPRNDHEGDQGRRSR